MLQIDARRFGDESREALERAERAEAAERRERMRRLDAEATAAELAHLLVAEVAARREAESALRETLH